MKASIVDDAKWILCTAMPSDIIGFLSLFGYIWGMYRGALNILHGLLDLLV
jgi:hypothetical protein